MHLAANIAHNGSNYTTAQDATLHSLSRRRPAIRNTTKGNRQEGEQHRANQEGYEQSAVRVLSMATLPLFT